MATDDTWPEPDPLAPEAAVDFIRAKVPLRKDEWLELDKAARDRAFTVAHLTQLDQIADVWRAIDRAISQGSSLEDFKKDAREAMTAAWGEDGPIYATVFLTNTLGAYAAGREAQIRSPDAMEARPYAQYVTAEDEDVCPICGPLDGLVLPVDDPAWEGCSPLMHQRCRCEKDTLSQEEAEAAGIDTKETIPDVEADDGFGGVPTMRLEPDLSSKPPELLSIYRDRVGSDED